MIALVVTLLILGVVIYLVETLVPIDATIKRCISAVVVVFVAIFLLRYLSSSGGF